MFEKLSGKWLSEASLKNILINGGLVSFVNPYSYLFLAKKNPDLFDKIDCWGADGELLRRVVNFLFQKNIDRLSFDYTSIANDVFAWANKNRVCVSVVGSTDDNLELFLGVLKRRYPGILLGQCRNGFFSNDDEITDFAKILALNNPGLVICGMGSEKQEAFLVALKSHGWSGAGFTCGGFIHQTASAGGLYYPKWIDDFNLRFLYRIYDEPKLIWRYLYYYPVFLVKAAVSFFCSGK